MRNLIARVRKHPSHRSRRANRKGRGRFKGANGRGQVLGGQFPSPPRWLPAQSKILLRTLCVRRVNNSASTKKFPPRKRTSLSSWNEKPEWAGVGPRGPIQYHGGKTAVLTPQQSRAFQQAGLRPRLSNFPHETHRTPRSGSYYPCRERTRSNP